jgi:inner membrane protein
MHFREFGSDVEALDAVRGYEAVQRLGWFNHGFMKAQQRGGRLVLSDLRMGAEPDYTFRFAVAERNRGGWREIAPQQLQWPWEARERLGAMWQRIWISPPAKSPPTSQPIPASHVEASRAAGP